MYDDNSTSRSGSLLSQAEFIPKLSKLLQESPSEVVADFEEFRKCRKLITAPFTNDKTQLIYKSRIRRASGFRSLGMF